MRRLLATLTAFFALAAPAHAAWTWPVTGDVITPYRNGTDPYASGQHRGIDIAAPLGSPVRAAASGEVLFAGTAGSSGMTISIRTGDGYDTSYLHLSSLAVRAGAHVAAGDRIGAVGTTGSRSSAAPHLHFGVRDAGTRHAYHDPLALLPPSATASAPNAPPPAAAPQPTPAPPAATPAPVTLRSTPSPGVAPLPVPRGVPSPAPRDLHPPVTPGVRAPVPRGALSPIPRDVPVRGGRVAPSPLERGAPSPAERAGRPAIDRAEPATAEAAGRRALVASDPAAVRTEPAREAARTDPARGPNLGWALACAGLLLAAGILGLTDSRQSPKRRRDRLAVALRPLLHRR